MKKLIKRINTFFKNLFDGAYVIFKKNSGIAVRVTQMLKIFVESPLADEIVNIIPLDYDDEILKVLRVHVPVVANKMAILHNIMNQTTDGADAVNKIINYLKTLKPDARISFWVMFAGELNVALSDGKLSLNESLILTQLVYKEIYEK